MPDLTRVTLLVEIDIESPPSASMLRHYVEKGIEKALAPKKLKHGEFHVWPRQLGVIEQSALAFAQAIRSQVADKVDNTVDSAIDAHEDNYNHRLID